MSGHSCVGRCDACETPDRPVDMRAVIVSEEKDIVYYRATMERERNSETVTVKEELLVQEERVLCRRRSCETPDGEQISRAVRIGE